MRIHEKSHLLEKQNGEYVSAKQSQLRLKWDYNIENLIKCIQRVKSKKKQEVQEYSAHLDAKFVYKFKFCAFFPFSITRDA